MHLVPTLVLVVLLPILVNAVYEPALINLATYSNTECDNVGIVDTYACTAILAADMTCTWDDMSEMTAYSVSVSQLYDGGPCDLFLFSGADDTGEEGYVPSADLAVGDCFSFTNGSPFVSFTVECLDDSYDS